MTEETPVTKPDMAELQEKIKAALCTAGYELSDEACMSLTVYMDGILERNKEINLTAVTDPNDFIKEHIVDSASVTRLEGYRSARRVCDVGTGAGFPGIVLAVMSPEKEFVLIDSLAKRLKVIEEFSQKAGIDNVTLVHARAEDAGHEEELREGFDFVTARAVAKLSVLSELCLPLVKTGGWFAAFKGASCEEEVKESKRAANILGAENITIQDAGVSDTKHVFAVMKKVRSAPSKYPRKAGTPARNPL